MREEESSYIEALQKENEQLRQRITKLETALASRDSTHQKKEGPAPRSRGEASRAACISNQYGLKSELSQQKMFFRKLVRVSPYFVFVYNLKKHKYTFSNWRICQFLGYTQKAFQKMGPAGWQELIHPEDNAKIREIFAELQSATHDRIVEISYRMKHRNREWRWLHARIVVFQRDADGGVLEIMGVAVDITEYRQTTNQLIRRKKLLDAVVESAPYGMIMMKSSGEIQLVNGQLERDFGYSRDELVGQCIEMLFPQSARTHLAEWQKPIFRRGEFSRARMDITLPGMRKDGSLFPLEMVLNPIFLEDEVVVLATLMNISARRRIETALREREAFLESIFKGTDVAIFVIDVTPEGDFEFVELNPAHERLTGLTTASIRGKKPEDLVPVVSEEAVAQIRANYQRCLDAGESIQYEEMIPFDGQQTWWLTRLTPIKDEEGNIYRIVGSATSITELKQIQTALKESEQRLEMALAGAELGSWDWNVQTGHVIFNTRWAEMLGYRPEEVEPHVSAWEKMLHPEDVAHTMEALHAHFNGETPVYESEQRLKTKSGEWKWILDRGKVFEWDNKGKPLRMCGTHLDITARKIAEEKVRQYATRLENINRELEEFSYVASHDLREPLRTINSYCELLKEDLGENISADAQEDIQFITEATRRMDRLIQDLLELSRTGRAEPAQELVDLNQCMEQITRDLKKVIEDTGAIVTWEPLPIIRGDAGQISRLFLNLVSNALKFCDKSQPRVWVRARKNGDKWAIEIADNGIGIEPAYKEQIFQPFRRLHGKAEYEGTGIGLAICRKIIERHGGKISVQSEPGKGSTFTIEIGGATEGAIVQEDKGASLPNGAETI